MAETQRWLAIPTQLELAEFEQFVLPHLVSTCRPPPMSCPSPLGTARSHRQATSSIHCRCPLCRCNSARKWEPPLDLTPIR
jgi:hypothetical protein